MRSGKVRDTLVKSSQELCLLGILLFSFLVLIPGCEGEKSGVRQGTSFPESVGREVSDRAGAENLRPPQGVFKEPAEVFPEVISVALTPRMVIPGTLLRATVKTGNPDDHLVLFDYEWYRNGEAISGEVAEELNTMSFHKGDSIYVNVTPFDGKDRGETKRSPSIVVQNRPPEITSSPPSAGAEGKYAYAVIATDPDADSLSYFLEKAPPGMVIDAVSGRLEWKIPDVQEGVFPVRIIASDGEDQAFQEFDVHLKKE